MLWGFDMEAQSDHLLAQRAASGDVAARDQLLARHYRSIERLCRRLCKDPTSVDDVLQETLIAVLRNLGRYRGDASFTTWAYTVARTHHGRALRADRRHRTRTDRFQAYLDAAGTLTPDGNEALASTQLRNRMRGALGILPVLDRAVLEYRDFHGYSAAETAVALDLTVPAVKTRLHRARVRLRALLQDPDPALAA